MKLSFAFFKNYLKIILRSDSYLLNTDILIWLLILLLPGFFLGGFTEGFSGSVFSAALVSVDGTVVKKSPTFVHHKKATKIHLNISKSNISIIIKMSKAIDLFVSLLFYVSSRISAHSETFIFKFLLIWHDQFVFD